MDRAGDDNSLIEAVLGGDRSAFEPLLDRHLRPVFGIAYAITTSVPDSEDVVQEAFLRAYRDLGTLRKARFGAWVAGIARNLAVDVFRGRKVEARAAADVARRAAEVRERSVEAASAERGEEARILREELAALPEHLRLPLVLYYFEDQSADRVAERLGIQAAAARKRLQLARDRLRDRLLVHFEGAIGSVGPSPKVKGMILAAVAAASLPGKPEGASTGGGAAHLRADGLSRSWVRTPGRARRLAVLASVLAAASGGAWYGLLRYSTSRTDGSSEPPLAARAVVSPAPSGGGIQEGGGAAATEPSAPAVSALASADGAPDARTAPSAGGVVLDARTDLPVPNAELIVRPLQPLPEDFPEENLAFAADAEGKFNLPALPEGRFEVEARPRGYWAEQKRLDVPGGPVLEFRLKPAAFVAGRAFLRERGHPIASNEIFIWKSNPEGNGRGGNTFPTGPRGEFVWSPMASGEHILTFRYGNFRPVSRTLHLTEAEPAEDLEVIFIDGLTLRGRMRNPAGQPLPHARTTWSLGGEPSGAYLECEADSSGDFTLPAADFGTFRVTLDGALRKPRSMIEVLVTDENRHALDVVFDAPEPIIVRVEDSFGRAASGVKLDTDYRGEHVSSSRSQVVTNEQGWRALSGLPRTGTIEVHADGGDLGRGRIKASLAGLEGPIVVRLEPLGNIAGKVIDVEGKPCHGFRVALVGSKGEAASGFTERDGRFELRAPGGEYMLEVNTPQRGHWAARLENVRVELGVSAEPLVVRLSAERMIRGRVLGPDGKPPAEARIGIHGTEAPGHHGRRNIYRPAAYTDAQGRFTVFAEPGSYALTVTAEGLRLPEPIEGVAPGGPPLEIRLVESPRPRIAGVVLENGKPIEGARVWPWIVGEDMGRGAGYTAITDREGTFFLPGILDTKSVVVVAQAPGFSFARSQEIAIPEDGAIEGVVVTPAGGADCPVHVKLKDGAPAAGVFLGLRGVENSFLRLEVRTDSSGAHTFPRLPPGEYRVKVSREYDGAGVERRFEWGPGGEAVQFSLGEK